MAVAQLLVNLFALLRGDRKVFLGESGACQASVDGCTTSVAAVILYMCLCAAPLRSSTALACLQKRCAQISNGGQAGMRSCFTNILCKLFSLLK